MIIAEQLVLGYFFMLFTKLFVGVSLFVDFWKLVQSISAPYISLFRDIEQSFIKDEKISYLGAASRCFGLCALAPAARGN